MRTLVSLLAVSCALAATDTANAQNRAFGVKGGITLASADIEDVSGTFDADNRTGWGVGAFLTLGGGVLSVQPELNFVENGFDAATPFGPAEVKLRYFVPAVLLRVGLPLPVVRPGVFGGVGVGFEAGCTINDVDCEDSPLALETKSSDPTGIFGADVDIMLGGSTSLRADARYTIGFSDIHEASDVWTEIKNRAWAVSAGVAFRF
jgi:hypothetical protein